MISQENNILVSAKNYVETIFTKKVSPSFLFHNLEHTQGVVKVCTEMAAYYKLNEDDTLGLLLAAWFHDTGYSNGLSVNHEETSIAIAREFMERQHIPEPVKEKTVLTIRVTRMPQEPRSLPEEIICDADLFHLGTDAFWDNTKSLRQELNLTTDKHTNKEEWAKNNLEFLEKHKYFTEYCRERLDNIKQIHIKKLKKKLNIPEERIPFNEVQQPKKVTNDAPPPVNNEEEKREKKIRMERPDRGIETMFRTTGSNHLRLSDMADSKANIMISVNSIIVSIIISVLFEKLEDYPYFKIPTAILLVSCVLAIIFSVLATRPRINSGTFTKEDIENKKSNLLFFGNFHQMSLEDYTWGMKQLMNNREYLYGSMIKDIYFLGVVLARKYKYLRASYNIFMFGLVISVLAFVVAFLLKP